VKLAIDWRALRNAEVGDRRSDRTSDLRPLTSVLRAPAIAGFQEEAAFAAGDAIPIAPGKGWLLVLEESHP
jgi:hypothetical protein